MTTGAWILVAAVAAALGCGLWRATTDGRFRHPAPPQSTPTTALLAALGQAPGARATLLQFSSAFCAPCRTTRRVLGEVAEAVPGVAHVEVDAESHLDAVRRLGIVRTPTTLVLDGFGREVSRASGAPRKEQVLAALQEAVGG